MNFRDLFLIFFLLISQASAQDILIYADIGACEECISETEQSLKNELSEEYNIKRIKAKELLLGHWVALSSAIVFPGGKASFYAELLNGQGNNLIKSFVENGGKYLGLCAGGYYGGAFVEFATGTNNEIVGSRELAFFPGKVIGPALAPYDYYSESGARIARVLWHEDTLSSTLKTNLLYYNGGGYFANAHNTLNTQVIASYDILENKPAAIVKIKVKEGLAILSGVHFEYKTNILKRLSLEDDHDIIKLEEDRKQLLRYILLNLNLKLR